jgi:hypothetical protein
MAKLIDKAFEYLFFCVLYAIFFVFYLGALICAGAAIYFFFTVQLANALVTAAVAVIIFVIGSLIGEAAGCMRPGNAEGPLE